jgi:chromosomal replication initiator protein
MEMKLTMKGKIGSVYSIPGLKYKEPLKSHSKYTSDEIIRKVGEHYGLAKGWETTPNRTRSKVVARQIAMYFIREKTNLSLKVVGNMFGGRDHTTVIHSVRMVKDLIQVDPSIRNDIRKIECFLL